MTSTALASTPSTTAITCGSQLYNIPTTDAACAVPNKSNYSQVLNGCCKSASIVEYDGSNCGLYCLAQGQSVGDLASCFTSNGVSWGDAFCNANMTATATAVATGRAGATGTGASAQQTGSSKGAAGRSVSKGGMGVLVVMGLALVAGVML